MTVAQAHLTPESFLGFTLPARGEEGLAPSDTGLLLKRLLGLQTRWDLVGPYVAFDGDGYVRKRLYRDADWEMLLLCWLPGQKTVVHDHGGSWGASLILSGEIHEWTYRWHGEGQPLESELDRSVAAPKLTVETLDTVHRVENSSFQPAISLHLYSPPLRVLNSYSIETGVRHAVPVDLDPAVAVGGDPQHRLREQPV
ncbi:MAG: cysteine dioxygenase family protein [Thermoanaerobaculia bacterium]